MKMIIEKFFLAIFSVFLIFGFLLHNNCLPSIWKKISEMRHGGCEKNEAKLKNWKKTNRQGVFHNAIFFGFFLLEGLIVAENIWSQAQKCSKPRCFLSFTVQIQALSLQYHILFLEETQKKVWEMKAKTNIRVSLFEYREISSKGIYVISNKPQKHDFKLFSVLFNLIQQIVCKMLSM